MEASTLDTEAVTPRACGQDIQASERAVGRKPLDPAIIDEVCRLLLAGVPPKRVQNEMKARGRPVSLPKIYEVADPYWHAGDPRMAPKFAVKPGSRGGPRENSGRKPGRTEQRMNLARRVKELREKGLGIRAIASEVERTERYVLMLLSDDADMK